MWVTNHCDHIQEHQNTGYGLLERQSMKKCRSHMLHAGKICLHLGHLSWLNVGKYVSKYSIHGVYTGSVASSYRNLEHRQAPTCTHSISTCQNYVIHGIYHQWYADFFQKFPIFFGDSNSDETPFSHQFSEIRLSHGFHICNIWWPKINP